MNLSAPKQSTFIVAAVLAAAAVLGLLTPIPFVSPNAFVVLAIGFAVLAAGSLTRGL